MLKTIRKLFRWMRMDNKNKDEETKTYIDILKEASQKVPNINLPSMGIIDNEKKLDIEAKDYFIKKDNQ